MLGQLQAGVADVVRRQREAGIDIVDDGEFGKTMWSRYIVDRLDGISPRADTLAHNPVFRGHVPAAFEDAVRRVPARRWLG